MKLFFCFCFCLFPVMRARWKFTRVRYGRARKTLVSSRRRINAKRDSVGVDLIQNESVHLVFDLWDAGQLALPFIVERSLCWWFEFARVLPHTGSGCVTASAHARVVPQTAFVQIWMIQGFGDGDSLVGVQCQHLAELEEKKLKNQLTVIVWIQ